MAIPNDGIYIEGEDDVSEIERVLEFDGIDEVDDEKIEKTQKTRSRVIPAIFATIMIILSLFIVARFTVISLYQIPTESMYDTIEAGDFVIALKSNISGAPQQGDILTFKDPEVDGRTLIKRCIATEGQVVDIKNGHVYVDGVMQNEPYGEPTYPLESEIAYPHVVGSGHVWMMGDNRDNSKDSRWFGDIPIADVTGKAVFIYFPFEHIGTLE